LLETPFAKEVSFIGHVIPDVRPSALEESIGGAGGRSADASDITLGRQLEAKTQRVAHLSLRQVELRESRCAWSTSSRQQPRDPPLLPRLAFMNAGQRFGQECVEVRAQNVEQDPLPRLKQKNR
jgi:hypothetical protein